MFSFITINWRGPPLTSYRTHVDGSPRALHALPCPPLVVTIDGGYVHSSDQTSRRDGWFQAVCGTVTAHDGRVRRFGFVPTIDTRPRRRIRDTLLAQGLQANQLVTVLSDGAVDLAGWTALINPTSEYILDWFHIATRFTVLANTMKGLHDAPDPDTEPDDSDEGDSATEGVAAVAEELRRDVGRAKWHVWHGNLPDALELLTYTSFGFDACTDNEARTKVDATPQRARRPPRPEPGDVARPGTPVQVLAR